MIEREVYLNLLQTVIEARHQCRAVHLESVAVSEIANGRTVWEGMVEVFKLINGQNSRLCYGWIESPNQGAQQFVIILQKGLIISPQNAVHGWLASRTVIIHPVCQPQQPCPQIISNGVLPEEATSGTNN